MKNELIYTFDKLVPVPLADQIKPLDRWEAYMKATAFSMGLHNRFSIATNNGKSMITVYKTSS